jgi:hypothetical protein
MTILSLLAFDAEKSRFVTRRQYESGSKLLLRLTKNLDEKARFEEGLRPMPPRSVTPSRSRALRLRDVVSPVVLAIAAFACSACASPPARKPIDMTPIGTVPNVERRATEEDDASVTTPNSGTPGPRKASPCAGGDFAALDETLRNCEVPMPSSAELPSNLRDKLEITVVASTLAVVQGGHVDLTVTFRNKSNEPLPLYFSGNHAPHFEVEALDTKGRRADLPAGKSPAWPKGAGPSALLNEKAWRVTLAGGASGQIKISWDAVKTRWAPEKANEWERPGFPRAVAGSLSPGKYTLRIDVPLVRGGLEAPKIAIRVTHQGSASAASMVRTR